MRSFFQKTLVLLLATATCQYSAAYTYWTCSNQSLKWQSNSTTMRYSSVSFQNAAWRGALDTAINNANQNPSKFRFNKSYNDTSIGFNNGQNEVWFTSDDSLTLGGAMFLDFNCGSNPVRIDEADGVFNVGYGFSTSTYAPNLNTFGNTNSRSFHTGSVHELGHAAGLAHTNNTYNVMGDDSSHVAINSNTTRAYLGEDAAHGFVFLYGAQSSGHEDVAVTSFGYTVPSLDGEYSLHFPTAVAYYTGELVMFNKRDVYGEQGPEIDPLMTGNTIQLQLTFENNGRTTRTEDIGFYLSTNNLITTYDTRLAGRTLTLGRGQVYTIFTTLTLPANLTRERFYYIGAIIDEDNSLSEMTESNNATRRPIHIGVVEY